MEFSIEKFISNFVESQFPSFYKDEGTDFILFTKAYYEWMESNGNPISEARKLMDYRDIDNTLESFLVHFQQKYLYGIPFNVIANKRLLLKHILDVYRSKGSVQCYKLLFKLIYNEDIEIYLPGVDVLRISDGTWIQPQYLEVSAFDNISDYMGKTVVGLTSETTATVENVVKEFYNGSFITIIYFSNMQPRGGSFAVNEKIIPQEKIGDFDFISKAPIIQGSLSSLVIGDGGRNYKLNDTVKIIQKDPNTNQLITYGKDGYLKVTSVRSGNGELTFDLVNGGYGFSSDSQIFIYKNDLTGGDASFDIGGLVDERQVVYNTDIVGNYLDKSLSAATFGFPGLPTANLNSSLTPTLSYSTKTFGSIANLTNIDIGSGYLRSPNVFIRSVTVSQPLNVTVSYNTGSNIVSLISSETIETYKNVSINAASYGFPRNPTANVSFSLGSTISLSDFYNLFEIDDVIFLQANSANTLTAEYHMVKEIAGLNQLKLYQNPVRNSTASAQIKAAPVIFPANFLDTDFNMTNPKPNSLRNGVNEIIRAFATPGNNCIATVDAFTGKGFIENEPVFVGLFGLLDTSVQIISGGNGYSNSDPLVIFGGQYARESEGYIITNNVGNIIDVVITDPGSGYQTVPSVYVQSRTGNNAVLKASVVEFNYDNLGYGRVRKGGNGKEFGYYSTTRGFLDADKYIQDSFYYQDYSYEIRVSRTLNKYKSILYDTFHTAGSELFGKFYFVSEEGTDSTILYENTFATITRNQ